MGLLDHVKIENLDEDQRKMVELVGLDGFKSLVRAFGGTTIYIPKAESLERAARDPEGPGLHRRGVYALRRSISLIFSIFFFRRKP